MIRKLIGLSLISLGIFLEVLWLGVCFGTVIIGIVLLIFAPQILFFPFTFFLVLGMAFLKSPNQSYSYNNNSNYSYQNSYSSNSYIQSENLDKYYEVLESLPEDDFSTIKNNYRRLIKEYHYDTISSKNLPKEMLQFAEKKPKSLMRLMLK
jgi:hypothetical protein